MGVGVTMTFWVRHFTLTFRPTSLKYPGIFWIQAESHCLLEELESDLEKSDPGRKKIKLTNLIWPILFKRLLKGSFTLALMMEA